MLMMVMKHGMHTMSMKDAFKFLKMKKNIRNSEFMCKKTGIEKMNLQIIFGFLIWNNYPVIIWMRFVKSIKTCRFLGECWKSLGEMVINDLNTLRPLAMNRKPLFF